MIIQSGRDSLGNSLLCHKSGSSVILYPRAAWPSPATNASKLLLAGLSAQLTCTLRLSLDRVFLAHPLNVGLKDLYSKLRGC